LTSKLIDFTNQRLQVLLDFGPSNPVLVLGECLWVESQKRVAFQWSEEAIASKLELSPLTLPLSKGVYFAESHPFNGLHALFSDSIPDGFGLRLMKKGLANAGYSILDLNPLHRLAWVGNSGIGALTYTPVIGGETSQILTEISMVAEYATNSQIEMFQDIPSEAIRAGGSALGARPKFWASLSSNKKQILLGDSLTIPKDFQPCLLKFAPTDGDEDEPYFEATCLKLAQEHGVRSAKAELLNHKTGPALAVYRFDRSSSGERVMMQSVAALLNLDYRSPSLDYSDLAKLVKKLAGESDLEQLYRQVCFNVALSIRDDHTKNFAFLMRSNGVWELSPAFDLCPNEGIGRMLEHNMTINGKGTNFSRSDLFSFGKSIGLSSQIINDGLDQARAASLRFEAEAKALGSSHDSTHEWANRLKKIDKLLALA
jgi:serine/threonine-protein kinase HipA